MYKFQTTNGVTIGIQFSHHKRGKKKPPTSTTCNLIALTDDQGNDIPFDPVNQVGYGLSKRIGEHAMIVDSSSFMDTMLKLGKAAKKVRWTHDKSQAAITLTGDNFSYEKARKYSLRKALEASGLDAVDRKAAWAAMLGDIVK